MSKMYLGLNLTQQNDYCPDQFFANLFLNSRSPQMPNFNEPPQIPTLDAQGWPTQDFRIVVYAAGTFPTASGGGTYAIKFTGKCAEIGVTGGVISNQVYNSGTNTTTATLTVAHNSFGTVFLDFLNTQKTNGSSTGTGITNVYVMRPIAENSATPHDFTEFLSRNFTAYIANGAYQGLRYMDMLGTNNYPFTSSTQPNYTTLSWSQRTPGYVPNQSGTYTGTIGTSIETCVAISNVTNKDMYYCMPDCADPDYMLKALQTIAFGSDGTNPYTSPHQNPVYPPLNSNLKLFIEFSNELWNAGFPQYARNIVLACQEAADNASIGYDHIRGNPSDNQDQNAYTLGYRRNGDKMVQISKLARQVFGDSAMMSRVRPVLMGWDSPDKSSVQKALTYIDAWYNNSANVQDPHPVTYYLWAAGNGAYRNWVAADTSNNSGSVDYKNNSAPYQALSQSILDSGVQNDPQSTLTKPAFHAGYGLKSVIYEGALDLGQDSATPFSFAFNQDSRLRPLVQKYYDDLNESNWDALFIFCSTQGNYAQVKSTEPGHVAIGPRYLAAQDFVADSSVQGSAITTFVAGPVALSQGTYDPSAVIYTTYGNFTSGGYLSIRVPATQANTGNSLSLLVDGVPVATARCLANGLIDSSAGGMFSKPLVAPITSGDHAIQVVALQQVKVGFGRSLDIILESEVESQTSYENRTFGSFTQNYTSQIDPPASKFGCELTMTTTDFEFSQAFVYAGGFEVGITYNTFLISDGGSRTVSKALNYPGGGINGTLGAEVRGNAIVAYLNDYEVLRLENLDPAPSTTTPCGYYLSSAGHAGSTTPSFRQYTIATVVPVVSVPVVIPSTITVQGGGTEQFTSDGNVTWSTSAGSITSGGLFTAPTSTSSVQTVTISATSTSDTSKIGVSMVTVPPSVVVNPALEVASWIGIDNLASTSLGIAHSSGSPSLVLRDASHFTPSADDPRIVTVVKADLSAACHYLVTAKNGSVLTVSPTDGYTDANFPAGSKVYQAFNKERLKELRDQIDALVNFANGLATVATSGLYNDLTGKPTLPTLATVATTGDFDDLTNKPSIPTLPTLSAVATTGDFDDLTNKPSIPAATPPGGSSGQIQFNDGGEFGGVSSVVTTGNIPLIITYANTDYTNTNGANSHLALNNPSATGQTVVSSTINGNLAAKWRTDYVGNVSWVAGSTGSHTFFVGGDSGAASSRAPLSILNSGAVHLGVDLPEVASTGGGTTPLTPLTILYRNQDYTNGNGGENSHILLTNPLSVGQNCVTSVINGVVVAKWRTDYTGGVNWVAAGSNGSHTFFVGGDAGQGVTPLTLGNDSSVTVSPAANSGFVVKGASGQSHDLVQHQDHTGIVLSSVDKLGAVHPPQLADSEAANGSLYYSTTAGKLVFKDPAGAINPLY